MEWWPKPAVTAAFLDDYSFDLGSPENPYKVTWPNDGSKPSYVVSKAAFREGRHSFDIRVIHCEEDSWPAIEVGVVSAVACKCPDVGSSDKHIPPKPADVWRYIADNTWPCGKPQSHQFRDISKGDVISCEVDFDEERIVFKQNGEMAMGWGSLIVYGPIHQVVKVHKGMEAGFPTVVIENLQRLKKD